MRRKIAGALAAFLGAMILVQVAAMGATSVDPLFVCVRVNFDWRAPYENGTCPTYYVKVEIQKAGGGGGGGGTPAPAPQYMASAANATATTGPAGDSDLEAVLPLSGYAENAPVAPTGAPPTAVPGAAQVLGANVTVTKISFTLTTLQAMNFSVSAVVPRATLYSATPGNNVGAPTPVFCDIPALVGLIPVGLVVSCSAVVNQPLPADNRLWTQVSVQVTAGIPTTLSMPFSASVTVM